MNIPVFTCQEINADGEMELKKEEGSCYAWLEETEVPENSKMDGIEYLGPQVYESRC
jgi:cysteamine dioxygenase